MKMYLHLFSLMLLLAFTSCGSKSSSVEVKLQGAFSQVAGLFDNGAVMLAVGGPEGKPPLLYSIPLNSSSFDHSFDHGTWKIMILGWHGAGASEIMAGSLYCSVLENVSIPEQTSFAFNLSQVDSQTAGSIDSDHPCEPFIASLETLSSMTICEETTCENGEYIRYNTDLSIKFGIPHYEGIINKDSIQANAKLTNKLSSCHGNSVVNSVGTYATDAAKFYFNQQNNPIYIPTRLAGGFYLPLKIDAYEDKDTNTSNCTAGYNGSLVAKNSAGELDTDTGAEIHTITSGMLNFHLPPTPFELSVDSLNYYLVRNSATTIQIGGPYSVGNDNYQGFAMSYSCEYKVVGDDDANLVDCNTSIGNGDISYTVADGDIYLDGSTTSFDIGASYEFKIIGEYYDDVQNTTVYAPEKRITVMADPITQINESIDITPMPGSDLDLTGGSTNIVINNYTDLVINFSIINDSGDSLTMSGDINCNNGSSCTLTITGSASSTGSLRIVADNGQEFYYTYTGI